MARPLRHRLTDAEKDALLERQSQLVEAQAARIEALMARIAALEARLGKPRKTSRNSHTPPSQAPGGGRPGGGASTAKPKKRTGAKSRLASEPGPPRRIRSKRYNSRSLDLILPSTSI